jgi:hypothetical protein
MAHVFTYRGRRDGHTCLALVMGANSAGLDVGEGARGRGLILSHGICIHADGASGRAYLCCALGSMVVKTENVHLSLRLVAASSQGLTGVLMRQPSTPSLTAGIAGCCVQSAWQSDERMIWRAGRKGEVETDEEVDALGTGAGRW